MMNTWNCNNLIELLDSVGVEGSILQKYIHIVGAEEYEEVDMALGDIADDTWYVINDWLEMACGEKNMKEAGLRQEMSDCDTEIHFFINEVRCSLNKAVNKLQTNWRNKMLDKSRIVYNSSFFYIY